MGTEKGWEGTMLGEEDGLGTDMGWRWRLVGTQTQTVEVWTECAQTDGRTDRPTTLQTVSASFTPFTWRI